MMGVVTVARMGPLLALLLLCCLPWLAAAARMHRHGDRGSDVGGIFLPSERVDEAQSLRASLGRPKALLVFGDSYVDTGNRKDNATYSRKQPYGITWPGVPSGRFSDGRVLSDWMATVLDLPSPTPYRDLPTTDDPDHQAIVRQGVNFAVGGSGVFRDFGFKTLQGQIDWLEQLIDQRVLDEEDIAQSLILVSTSNNDYYSYVSNEHPLLKLPFYIARVVASLSRDIERLFGLGGRRFVVTNLMPLGCLPAVKEVAHARDCFTLGNLAPYLHNYEFYSAIKHLRYQFPNVTLVVADIHKVLADVTKNASTYGLKNVTEACCDPEGGGIHCGMTNSTYNVCTNPTSTLYWDSFHLTDVGYKSMVDLLYNGTGYTDPGPNLRQVIIEGR